MVMTMESRTQTACVAQAMVKLRSLDVIPLTRFTYTEDYRRLLAIKIQLFA